MQQNQKEDHITPVIIKKRDGTTQKFFKSGLIVEDLILGDGDEVGGCDTVVVHCVACVQHGSVFENSYKKCEPLIIPLGQGKTIPGVDQGIYGMRVGGIRRLIIPASMGFGSRTIPGIPQDSILEYEIELLEISEW